MRKHILIGVGAGLLLLPVYFGIITLVQDARHAFDQFVGLWYWLIALAIGFGVQVGLFSFIRQELHARHKAATASVAASGGVSAGSMVACCAHHLSEVLPFLGLAGLASFLVNYQVFFLFVGVLSNVVGITFMLETIQRHGLCPWVAGWKWNVKRGRKWVTLSAGLLLVFAFFLNFVLKGAHAS